MSTRLRWIVAFLMVSGAYGSADAGDLLEGLRALLLGGESAPGMGPAWTPSHEQVAQIEVAEGPDSESLKNFCLNHDGNILTCYGSNIRVYSPEGKLLETLPLEIKPGAVDVAGDGSIFVGGDGRLLRLDSRGKILASAKSPVADKPVVITDDMEEMLRQSEGSLEEAREEFLAYLKRRRADVTGLTVTDKDVFIAVGAPDDFTYQVYRLNHGLENPELVVQKLRGCCGQMDIQSHAGDLWIPHNGRHRVEQRDRDGKELSKFGSAGKVKPEDFGGCCEPKCMRVLPGGDLVTAESGPPTCIKRFSPKGKFLELIAVVEDSEGDCVRVTVDRSPDGSRYYMLDTKRNLIRVFGSKG